MRVLPIRYCADVAESTRFYRALGLDLGAATRPGSWVELPAAAGVLALHKASGHPGSASWRSRPTSRWRRSRPG